MKYYMPTRLFTGKDCLKNNGNLLKKFGNKCLIVTGQNSARKSGALDDLIQVLNENGIVYLIYDEIKPNPTVSSCIEAGKIAYYNHCEFIIGIGGGSPLDAAKAVSLFAADPDLNEDGLYKGLYRKALPVICIGTTAGTGSEVTMVSVLTNSKGLKKSIHHDLIFPVISFGDPKYTLNLPYEVSVSTAIDAFAHLLESYCSRKADDITRSYSFNGCRMIYPVLRKFSNKDELSYEDRETLYNASILGGMAIAETGTCFPHTMGYYLSENYHIPHGIACSIFMEDIIRHMERNDKQYIDNLFENIGVSIDEFIKLVDGILPDINIQFTEEELQNVLPRYINNSSVLNTRGDTPIEEIEEILRKKFIK